MIFIVKFIKNYERQGGYGKAKGRSQNMPKKREKGKQPIIDGWVTRMTLSKCSEELQYPWPVQHG